MINLFRKERRKLLANNKFIKYLIYALGEIVLIITGLLIALQLNNLNSFNNQQKDLIIAVKNISHELDQEIQIMKVDLNNYENHSNYLQLVLTKSYSDLDLNLFMRTLTRNSMAQHFGANYYAALASGKLSTLPDSISQDLISYYQITQRKTDNSFDFHETFVSNTIEDHVMRNYKLGYNKEMDSIRTIEIIESGELITFINYQARNFSHFKNLIKSNIDEAEELNNKIKTYIKLTEG